MRVNVRREQKDIFGKEKRKKKNNKAKDKNKYFKENQRKRVIVLNWNKTPPSWFCSFIKAREIEKQECQRYQPALLTLPTLRILMNNHRSK